MSLCPSFHPFFSLAREHRDCLRFPFPTIAPHFFFSSGFLLFIMYSTRGVCVLRRKKSSSQEFITARPTITWARIMSAFTIVSRRRMFVFIAQSLAIIRIRRQNSEFSWQPRMWLRFGGWGWSGWSGQNESGKSPQGRLRTAEKPLTRLFSTTTSSTQSRISFGSTWLSLSPLLSHNFLSFLFSHTWPRTFAHNTHPTPLCRSPFHTHTSSHTRIRSLLCHQCTGNFPGKTTNFFQLPLRSIASGREFSPHRRAYFWEFAVRTGIIRLLSPSCISCQLFSNLDKNRRVALRLSHTLLKMVLQVFR